MKWLVLLLLCSCSLKPVDVQKVVDKYIVEDKQDFSVSFKDIQRENIAAYAMKSLQHIDIDRKYWYSVSDKKKAVIVLHEFGHLRGLGHFNVTMPVDYCPISLMFFKIPHDYCLNKYWKWYLEELEMRLQSKERYIKDER